MPKSYRALEDPEVAGSLRTLARLIRRADPDPVAASTSRPPGPDACCAWPPDPGEVPAPDTLLKDPGLAPEGRRRIDFAASP
jgi:hypothetical protein